MNDSILEKVDNIVAMIKDSKEYHDYQFLFHKLKNNEKANSLIKRVKDLQKQVVKKEILKESTTELENEIDYLLQQLNKIPLYVEFIQKQEELNQIYQIIIENLNQYFFELTRKSIK